MRKPNWDELLLLGFLIVIGLILTFSCYKPVNYSSNPNPLGIFIKEYNKSCKRLHIEPAKVALATVIRNAATEALADGGTLWHREEWIVLVRRDCIIGECSSERMRIMARHEACHLLLHKDFMKRDFSTLTPEESWKVELEAEDCVEKNF